MTDHDCCYTGCLEPGTNHVFDFANDVANSAFAQVSDGCNPLLSLTLSSEVCDQPLCVVELLVPFCCRFPDHFAKILFFGCTEEQQVASSLDTLRVSFDEDRILPVLRGGLWHTTHPSRFESILQSGAIFPEPEIPGNGRHCLWFTRVRSPRCEPTD